MEKEITFKRLPDALAYGISAAKASKRIALGRGTEGLAAESAVCAGLIRGGSDVILMNKCIKPQLFLASRISGCGICIFVKDNGVVKAEISERGGLPVTDNTLALIDGENEKQPPSEGRIINGHALGELYLTGIRKLVPSDCRYNIKVSSSSGVKESFGDPSGSDVIIQLSPDGTKASLYSEKSGFVSYSSLVLLYCTYLFENGRDAALPYDFTFAAERTAQDHGRKILRYFSGGDGTSDREARILAERQRFTLDGLFLALSAVRILREKNMPIENISGLIPQSHSLKKYISVDCSRVESLLSSKKGKLTPDGTDFSDKNGRILMSPSESGRGLWLNVESYSMETASELFGKIEETLRKLQEKNQ